MDQHRPVRLAARTNRRLATVGVLLALAPGAVRAESLYDAIALAYQTNPALRAQRAELRAVDETYVQAKSGYGPQVSLSGQVGYQDARVQQGASLFSPARATDFRAGTGTADLALVQPLFTAGAVHAQVQGAAAGVLAGRQALRQVESQVLQNVVTAYLDVRRDRETIRIIDDEIAALTREFNETKAKGAMGQLTKTDVAESEARLLSAQAQRNLSLGRLNVSNAEYLNAVGQNPGQLEPEPELAGLPATVDQAFDTADNNNPQLLGAIETEQAMRQKVNEAKAANGLTIALRLDAAVSPNEPYLQRQYDSSIAVAATVKQPLFTSGLNASRIRQALEEDNRAQMDVETARRGVVQLVAQAWDQLISTRSAIDIEEHQVGVETTAVEGNRIEERVGQRSTIDLLNAELELANARLGLVQSRHDEYLASAAVLAAMGLLEARFQTPAAAAYHPEASLRRVETLGATPLEPVIAIIDGLGAPATPAPRLSAPNAGAERPQDTPPQQKTAP